MLPAIHDGNVCWGYWYEFGTPFIELVYRLAPIEELANITFTGGAHQLMQDGAHMLGCYL